MLKTVLYLPCTVVVCLGEGAQSRRYIAFQKSTMAPLSATVYRKFVGVGGYGWGSGYKI